MYTNHEGLENSRKREKKTIFARVEWCYKIEDKTYSQGFDLQLTKKANENGYARIVVLTGTKEVVKAFNGDLDWEINLIIDDIKKLALTFDYIEFYFISKSFNSTSYSLAKPCLSSN